MVASKIWNAPFFLHINHEYEKDGPTETVKRNSWRDRLKRNPGPHADRSFQSFF